MLMFFDLLVVRVDQLVRFLFDFMTTLVKSYQIKFL